MASFVAVLDANVLYPAPVRDVLMEVAAEGTYQARWTEHIHDEWIRNLVANRDDLDPSVLRLTAELMNKAVPDCLIEGYEHLVDALSLPDTGDCHILAAAIVAKADVIVTFNLKHFPDDQIARYGLEAQHPDEFLNHQRTLDPDRFLRCVKRIRKRLRKPAKTADEYIATLERCRLTVIAAELDKVRPLI